MNMIPDIIALDAPHLTLLFGGTILCLATAFVWMFCELERRLGKSRTLPQFGYRRDGRNKRDS